MARVPRAPLEMKPGDDALLILPLPRLHLRAVRVARVWRSVAGTERVEVVGTKRRAASFDARQFIPLAALENLPAAPAEKSASNKKAGAVAV